MKFFKSNFRFFSRYEILKRYKHSHFHCYLNQLKNCLKITKPFSVTISRSLWFKTIEDNKYFLLNKFNHKFKKNMIEKIVNAPNKSVSKLKKRIFNSKILLDSVGFYDNIIYRNNNLQVFEICLFNSSKISSAFETFFDNFQSYSDSNIGFIDHFLKYFTVFLSNNLKSKCLLLKIQTENPFECDSDKKKISQMTGISKINDRFRYQIFFNLCNQELFSWGELLKIKDKYFQSELDNFILKSLSHPHHMLKTFMQKTLSIDYLEIMLTKENIQNFPSFVFPSVNRICLRFMCDKTLEFLSKLPSINKAIFSAQWLHLKYKPAVTSQVNLSFLNLYEKILFRDFNTPNNKKKKFIFEFEKGIDFEANFKFLLDKIIDINMKIDNERLKKNNTDIKNHDIEIKNVINKSAQFRNWNFFKDLNKKFFKVKNCNLTLSSLELSFQCLAVLHQFLKCHFPMKWNLKEINYSESLRKSFLQSAYDKKGVNILKYIILFEDFGKRFYNIDINNYTCFLNLFIAQVQLLLKK